MEELELLATLMLDADRRCPGGDAISQRILTLTEVPTEAAVLDLSGGAFATGRLLARTLKCALTCGDYHPPSLERAKELGAKDGIEARLKTVEVDPAKLELPDAAFQVVIAEGALRGARVPLMESAKRLRRALKPAGRLALSLPARVGLHLPKAVGAFYEERSVPLLYPREIVQELERGGFEPLAVEGLADSLVDGFYSQLEQRLSKLVDGQAQKAGPLRREIDVYRREGGRTSVNTVLVVARRKEANERPPPARGHE